MTDTDRNFLASICAAPDDDLPRLSYADWLDEHGDPRGEFIRIQCELANLVPLFNTTPAREFQDRYAPLRRRERELLRLAGDWLPPVAGLVQRTMVSAPDDWWHATWHNKSTTIIGADFVRGFPSVLTLSWSDWAGGPCPHCEHWGLTFRPCPQCNGTRRVAGHADALLKSCPIRRIDRAPRRECTGCRPDGLWHPSDTFIGECRRCHGTGTLPAVVPDWRGDGVVRLTVAPNDDECIQHGAAVLAHSSEPSEWTFSTWPGVKFELPAQINDAARRGLAERRTGFQLLPH